MAINPPTGRVEWDGNLTGYNRLVPIAIAEAALQVFAKRAVREIQQELRAVDRMDTGALSNSWQNRHSLTPLGPSIEVYSTLPYARWVDQGTGIYGPKGTPITRPGGGPMRFNPGRRNSGSKTPGVGRRKSTNAYGGGGQFTGSVYATSVRGQEATHYLDRVRTRMNITWFFIG